MRHGAGGRRDPTQGELLPLEQDLARLRDSVAFTRQLAAALCDRDDEATRALLDDPRAGALPSQVREEAMVFLTLPAQSTRAPMHTLLHAGRMTALLDSAARAPNWRRAG